MLVGENWEVMNHQWACFAYFLGFHLSVRSKQPWQFSVIRSLKFAKGTKGLHKKWRQLWQVVVCRCSVPSVISSDHITAFTEMLSLTFKMACIWFQFASFFFNYRSFWSCTLHLVWREGRWAKFWCSTMQVQYLRSCKMYPLYRNLQHVVYQDWMGGTQWHSTDI